MGALTRMASWLGFGSQRAAQLDPFIAAALTERYGGYGAEPISSDSAARKIAVGATVRLITNTGRTMPIHAFTGEAGETRQLTTPPLMLDPDGTGRGLDDWVAQALWSLAARGNLMVHVLARDGSGRPLGVEVMNPDRVKPQVDGDGQLWWRTGTGPRIPGRDVLHRRMYPRPGVTLGLSPIEEHAATIGMGIAAETFGGNFFAAGGHPTALLKSASPLTQPQADNVKSKFRIAADSREPVLLPDGISYEQIQVKPNESQFLDAQKYTSAEICRMIGPGVAEMLGYETGGAMTYQNVQSRSLHLLIYAIDPWLVRLEKLISDMFLPKPQYVRFNRDALLRMTATDRWTVYQMQLKNGARTINEVRDDENEAPVTWGEEPFVPGIAPSAAAAEVNNSDPEALP